MADALKATARGTVPLMGAAVAVAERGALVTEILTFAVAVAGLPAESCTVKTTGYDPGVV